MDEKVFVELKKLPKFEILEKQVNKYLATLSWIESHGWEWLRFILAIVIMPVSIKYLINYSYPFGAISTAILLGWSYMILAQVSGHLAAHGAMSSSNLVNKIVSRFCIEFCGTFSCHTVHDAHIKGHHPHTNIVGLGDSSTWKAPFLPSFLYMFFGPLALPWLTPLVLVQTLWGNWFALIPCVVISGIGFYVQIWMLVTWAQYYVFGSFMFLMLSRSIFSIPYVHFNIFQHIGLPMWDRKDRPKRFYQMTHGVLNLDRNIILDLVFGHALINCHVEHHLFPKLSDSQCLAVKPLVYEFLRSTELPYHEKSYWNRLLHFLANYEKLMVQSPPIIHFVGIQ